MTAIQQKIDDRSHAAGAGFRGYVRYTHARGSLLAAGTTYYIFLSMFALITVAFGLTALIGSDALSRAIDQALTTAFPALTGGNGLDPDALQQLGQATSVIGLLILLYSGSGAMVATSESIHQIYGAPKDGRNFVVARLRLLGWMVVIAPMILISFSASLVVAAFADPILGWLGTASSSAPVLLRIGTSAVSFAIGLLVVYLVLGHLGGIRPPRTALLTGALVGAVGIEILKGVMAQIVAWSVSKPQYGAFAVPITVLLVLYLLTLTTYLAASLTAGIAESGLSADEADPQDSSQPPASDADPAAPSTPA